MKLFEGFSIRRWNDQIRPVEFVEMDKHGHKMAVAYCLARLEEDQGLHVNWDDIVRGGVFELFRRIVLADIKSPVYRQIRLEYPDVFRKVSSWIYDQMKSVLSDQPLRDEFWNYLMDDGAVDGTSQRILSAAHLYASYWEFRILQDLNPTGPEMMEISNSMLAEMTEYLDLLGMRHLMCKRPISLFLDLFGHLRFQIRWSQTSRIPQTSVLGHAMFVATLSYLMSRQIDACPIRLRNNFFGGLFHDLPEALTRDIISPVKQAEPTFPEAISEIEKKLVEAKIYPLLPVRWQVHLRYLLENEFTSKIRSEGVIKNCCSSTINADFNVCQYDPYDGEIIRACDELAAFVEAYASCSMGISTAHLEQGMVRMRDKYKETFIADQDIGSIYSDF